MIVPDGPLHLWDFASLPDGRYRYRVVLVDVDGNRFRDLTASICVAALGYGHDRYLEALDNGKLFFTAQDVARVAPYKAKIGESIKNGDTAPAFEMFALYKQRVNQRVENFVHLAGFVAIFGLILAVTVFGDLARLLRR